MLKRIVLAIQFLWASSVLLAQIQIKVTLSGTPSSVVIAKKNLKYGKDGAFCFIYDDRAPSAMDGASIMPYYSDGTGKLIRYTATIASNGVNSYLQDADGMPIAKIKDFVAANWGISCHGYIHSIPSSWISQGYNVYKNVVDNRKYHYDKLKTQGAEYILRTGVVPNADQGYETAWKQIGSLCGTSQNAFDTFPANPSSDWVNSSIGDISTCSGKFQVFARAFRDLTNQDATNELISKLGALLQQSTASSNKLLVFGTHVTDNTYFSQALTYLKNNSNDRIWVTSLHELMEYGETKDKTDIRYSISGNVVTINLDQRLPDAARWRDLSLGLTSDKTIVSISYSGADSVSFNSLTGLINVFKKKTVGFLDPSAVNAPLPVRFISFFEKNGDLQWTVGANENLSHYEIEKSTDGINFFIVGKTSAESFKDASTGNRQFYRIKAVDKDGSYVYSSIISTNDLEKKPATVVSIGSSTRLNFYANRNQHGDVSLFSTTGQLLFKSQKQFSAGWNSYDIPGLRPGIYIFKVLNETVKYSKF